MDVHPLTLSLTQYPLHTKRNIFAFFTSLHHLASWLILDQLANSTSFIFPIQVRKPQVWARQVEVSPEERQLLWDMPPGIPRSRGACRGHWTSEHCRQLSVIQVYIAGNSQLYRYTLQATLSYTGIHCRQLSVTKVYIAGNSQVYRYTLQATLSYKGIHCRQLSVIQVEPSKQDEGVWCGMVWYGVVEYECECKQLTGCC